MHLAQRLARPAFSSMTSTDNGGATHPAKTPEPVTPPGRPNTIEKRTSEPTSTKQSEFVSNVGANWDDAAATNPPTNAASLASKALQFIAGATPATLAAVAVGLSAVIYAILGKFGLLLIGAIAGVFAFVSLEARNPAIAQAVRGEDGSEVLDRVWLDLKSASRRDGSGHDEDDEESAFKSFDDFRPETRDALAGFVDAVIRDYVKWWYSPIIPGDHSFPLSCRRTLNSYLLSISNRMTRKRPADSFLDFLTNCSSIVIALMSELAAAFGDLPPETNMTAADAVYNYLASHPDSRLSNLLNQKQQAAKFRMVAEDLLTFLDKGTVNCDPARVFLREILSNSILETTLQTCSKAEWINAWIVYLLEAGEPDLNQAIDVGMQTGRDAGSTSTVSSVFADIDGNVGNIGIAKPARANQDTSRRKESLGHKKKLSRADEEAEVVMDEMKKMNVMIAEEQGPRGPQSQMPRQPEDHIKHQAVNGHTRRDNQEGMATASEASRPHTAGSRDARSEESRTSGDSGDKSQIGVSTDGFSSRSDTENPPFTPKSTDGSASPHSSPHGSSVPQFTSFDQIVAPTIGNQGEDEEDGGPRRVTLTLHNASFTLHDDSTGDSAKIRSKPTWDYLIQVEPVTAGHSGWMIVRRYSDFETLHEILRRIAMISGATAFTELHKEMPSWKIHTRESLRGELERYLRDGCWYQTLAESEGMKRFLEKSQGHTHGDSKAFAWEAVGKNMLDVLTTAPKGAMEGGKTLVGGVTGVFGNIAGLTRKTNSQSVDLTTGSNRLSISTPPRMEAFTRSPARSERASMDSQRSSVISTQPGKMAPMEGRPSFQSQGELDGEFGRVGRQADRMETGSASASAQHSREHSRASSLAALRSPSAASLDMVRLPPPPDEMASDYESGDEGNNGGARHRGLPASASTPALGSLPADKKVVGGGGGGGVGAKAAKQFSQMSEQETRVAVELLFAVINEMYTLSSAWNIRRTLLTAAKSFLLRPGNPSLLTVQSLIQTSVLDANTSDEGIAAQLRKLRENTMPTDEERAAWPADLTADEKEKLAVKARKLLIQSGVPAALMGVMGQAATGEALGRVFDCLQIEEVARGLIFGLMLQAVRIVTH